MIEINSKSSEELQLYEKRSQHKKKRIIMFYAKSYHKQNNKVNSSEQWID